MKTIMIFLFVLFCISPIPPATALTVDLLASSYSYDLFQDVSYTRGPDDGYLATQRVLGSSNQPFSQKLILDPYYFTSQVFAKNFSLYAWSESNTGGPPNPLDSSPYSKSGHGHAFVSASWLFRPIAKADNLTVNYFGDSPDYSAGYIVLFDVTENLAIFSWSYMGRLEQYIQREIDRWCGPYQNSGQIFYDHSYIDIENIFVNNHTYEFKMGVLAQSSGDTRYTTITANMNAVPEASSIILLGFGLLSILGLSGPQLFKEFKAKNSVSGRI